MKVWGYPWAVGVPIGSSSILSFSRFYNRSVINFLSPDPFNLISVEDKIRENEAVKVIRFKEGLLKLSNAYTELGRKCTIIFEAQRNISHQIPDVYEKDLEDIKYTGKCLYHYTQ